MLGYERVDGFLVEVGEYLDVFLSLCVAHVEPELVESIRSGASRVEPDVAALGLAELLAVSLSDKRTGQCIGVSLAQCPADKLRACGDVAPLVASAHLQMAVLVLVEPEEIIALEKLVAEFGE